MGSNKVNKNRFDEKPLPTERIILKKNYFVKRINANKRPYSSEPTNILYSICPNDILSDNNNSKVRTKQTQVQKRKKFNNLDTN